MIEWGGWRYDETARRLFKPRTALLGTAQGAVFAGLLRAAGAPVSGRALAGEIEKVSSSRDPLNCVGPAVHKLNLLFRLSGIIAPIENVRRFGYRLRAASPTAMTAAEVDAAVDEVGTKRAAVEAILVDQFEATAPHARAVAKMIEEVYGDE